MRNLNKSVRDYIHRGLWGRVSTGIDSDGGGEVLDREVIIDLLTGLGEKYERIVEAFDHIDDYTLQQVKIKLTSREKQTHGENAFYTQGKKRRSSGGGSAHNGQQHVDGPASSVGTVISGATMNASVRHQAKTI
ncbi:hypothetical protein GQ600_10028 [Phytophthora cactorum]|nr:hypothetical protein GQ600_10028 [Phytophthora cactorum]